MARLDVGAEHSISVTHRFNISVEPLTGDPGNVDDEFLLVVNRHVVKRMSRWQAERMGLVMTDG